MDKADAQEALEGTAPTTESPESAGRQVDRAASEHPLKVVATSSADASSEKPGRGADQQRQDGDRK